VAASARRAGRLARRPQSTSACSSWPDLAPPSSSPFSLPLPCRWPWLGSSAVPRGRSAPWPLGKARGWRDTEVTEMVEVTAVGGARAGGGPPPVEGLGRRLAQLAREGAPTAGVLAERRAAELRHGLASRTLQAPPRARLAPPRSLEALAAVERDAILRRPSAATQNASGVCVVGWRGDLIPKCTVPNLFWVWVPIWVCCRRQPNPSSHLPGFCRCAFNPTAPPPPVVAAAPYKSRRAKLRRPRRYAYAALREPNSESL